MKKLDDKTSTNKTIANRLQKNQSSGESTFLDSNTSKVTQLKDKIQGDTQREKLETIQEKANNTGLPYNIKLGIENFSGYSMADVNVNFNSDKPAQLNAYAYAQGTDIHIDTRQEKHLPHEAWQVVQQAQGRVKPTSKTNIKIEVNDNLGLEKEADVMASKVMKQSSKFVSNTTKNE